MAESTVHVELLVGEVRAADAGFFPSVAIIGDYFVDMASLIADIDNDAPEEEFWEWYSYCEDACELDLVQPTLEAWLQGCPRYEERELLDLRAAQRHINEIKTKYNGK